MPVNALHCNAMRKDPAVVVDPGLCSTPRVPSPVSAESQLPTLAETLTQLTMNCHDVWSLTAADLPPLLFLQQLRTLRLMNWPRLDPARLTAEDRAPFEQRPCAVLPHLESFQWTARLF